MRKIDRFLKYLEYKGITENKATCWCNITGHSIGNPTTSIYIDFNQAKVDEANRRVLDFVFKK